MGFEKEEQYVSEMQQDSQFLSLIRDVNMLKDLYSKVKKV